MSSLCVKDTVFLDDLFRGGLGGGGGVAASPFSLHFQNLFETLTILYFVSRIRPQCCMLPVLKSGGGGGGGGGLGLLYLNFLDPPLRSLHKWKEETKLEERGCRVTD